MITTPARNGLCIAAQIDVDVYSNITNSIGIGGISPNGGVCFGDSGLLNCINNTLAQFSPIPGCHQVTTVCGSVTLGTICLVIQDASSGAGTYNVYGFLNGSIVCSKLGVALTFDTTFACGILHTPTNPTNNAQWDNFKVWTS